MTKLMQATTDMPHENITIRAPRAWLENLDAWRASQPVPPKRVDVIKLAVLQFIDRQRAEHAARKR